MFSGNSFPRKGTGSDLEEIDFLLLRVEKRDLEISIE
jgi:hypothetical protein